jgi:hypothetical protein
MNYTTHVPCSLYREIRDHTRGCAAHLRTKKFVYGILLRLLVHDLTSLLRFPLRPETQVSFTIEASYKTTGIHIEVLRIRPNMRRSARIADKARPHPETRSEFPAPVPDKPSLFPAWLTSDLPKDVRFLRHASTSDFTFIDCRRPELLTDDTLNFPIEADACMQGYHIRFIDEAALEAYLLCNVMLNVKDERLFDLFFKDQTYHATFLLIIKLAKDFLARLVHRQSLLPLANPMPPCGL